MVLYLPDVEVVGERTKMGQFLVPVYIFEKLSIVLGEIKTKYIFVNFINYVEFRFFKKILQIAKIKRIW